MRAKVYGQVAGQRVTKVRVVTLDELLTEWGPFAMAVFHARRNTPLTVGDKRVWIELVP